jgi:hypothetical protein
MSSPFFLKVSALLAAVVLCLVLLEAWRADRRDRAQLNAELAATKQLLAAADARQHDRDAQLAQTLATLAAEKRTIVTPAQIVRETPPRNSSPGSHRSANPSDDIPSGHASLNWTTSRRF